MKVLHVPFTYFPEPAGGTEIYVSGLAAELRDQGVESAVAAPSEADAEYQHEGTAVFRFAKAKQPHLDNAYGEPDREAAWSFRRVLASTRPDIVHLHARTAAVSVALATEAAEAGAKVVLTYHTPTVSCLRGSMVFMGETACDGELRVGRCTACVLQRHGATSLVGGILAMTPQALGRQLGRLGLEGGPLTGLRMSALVGASHRRFHELVERVDCVVAVCTWVADVLRLNGVPETKLALCRQGVDRHGAANALVATDRPTRDGKAVLRIGYFGRLDITKGVDILIDALRRIPKVQVQLDIYGVRQPGPDAYIVQLERAAAADSRIRFLPARRPDEVIQAMSACDMVAIPSRWLETGPLVVLEAFAAGTPVLGAHLGGVRELVIDGEDGALVPPHDPAAWADKIAELAADPSAVARLRAGVRPPRTMADAAGEMASLYEEVLAQVGAR